MKDLVKLLKGFCNFFLKCIHSVYRYMLRTYCMLSAVISARDTRVMKRQVGSLPGIACDPAKKKPLSK